MLVLLNDKKLMKDSGDRPHLIHMSNCQYIKIHDIIFKNSPNFHLKMDGCHDAELYNINIKVNTTAQFNLLKKFSLEGSIIMYPYNTDGIDPSGGRMHIYNITVQNYDDVVVPKPSPDTDCTRDMLV
jgi:polygalacturonase